MPLLTSCPQCKRKLKIGDDAVGKNIKCPGCATVFAAKAGAPPQSQEQSGEKPQGAAVAQCTCPSCRTTLKMTAPVSPVKQIKCPKCATVFSVQGGEVPIRTASPTAAPAGDKGVSRRDENKAAPTPRRRAVPDEEIADEADHDDDETEERAPRRRAGKTKQRKASRAFRVSALILGLIGGLFSGGLGTAWVVQANSPEVKAMRELAAAIARDANSKEVDAEMARLNRMVRSSYFLLLAAPLGIAGGILASLGRVKLGGALMLAAVPIPLFLNVVTLMALYFLIVGGLVAVLTPSWPQGGGPPTVVVALLTAGGWVAVLVGWVLVLWAVSKTFPDKKSEGGITYIAPPEQRGGPNPPPPQFIPPQGAWPPPQLPPLAEAPKAGMGSKILAGFQWKEFKDPNGRYTVLMPKQPKEQLPNYFVVTALEFGDINDGVYSYDFSVLYDKRENEERTLEEQIKDWREANTDAEFKPIEDQAIQVKGHSGWEIVYKKPKEKEFMRRWFIKLKEGVALVSVVVPDTPEWIAASIKFFDSFTPLDK